MQLWDLDNILQGSGNTQRNEAGGAVDSDDDEMDLDDDPSKNSKGEIWFVINVNVIESP